MVNCPATLETNTCASPGDVCGSALETYHAPALRQSAQELAPIVALLQQYPVIEPLLEAQPELAVLINAHRQIVDCNRVLLRMVGKTEKSEVIGLRLGEALNCVHSRETPGCCGTSETCRTCGAVNAVLGCQQSSDAVRQECRISIGDPDQPEGLDLEVVVTPLALGELKLMVLAARDIAAIKRREVFERFFFHDALNVAGAIRGLAALLEAGEPFDLNTHPQRLRAMAQQLIEQLRSQRDLAATERGEFVPAWSTVRIRDLFNDLFATYTSHPAARQRSIVFAPPSPPHAAIQSDPILLERVLGNLIKNALEACDPGQAVTVLFQQHDEAHVRFSVHNPTVMPREVQLQIFKRSFSTKAEKGRGLGTFSVKLLTAQHLGGRVTFTSSEAAGTTFTVVLPRARTVDWAPFATAGPGEHRTLRGKRLLLAEDDFDNRRLITHLLTKAGAEVVAVEHGQIAVDRGIAACEQGTPFDAILMDMNMPQMDGWQAARLLRKAGYSGPIVALTAHATVSDRQMCVEAGCDSHAVKPIEHERLLELLCEQLPVRSHA